MRSKNKLDLYSLKKDFGEIEINKTINTTGVKSIRKTDSKTTTSDLCFYLLTKLLMIVK